MNIKAIETRYKGYRFRSRLEARWAVAFDALTWPWKYENEGYVLPSGEYYLPDFVVQPPILFRPSHVIAEVKPVRRVPGFLGEHFQKLLELQTEHQTLALGEEPNGEEMIYSRRGDTFNNTLDRVLLFGAEELVIARAAFFGARFEHGEQG